MVADEYALYDFFDERIPDGRVQRQDVRDVAARGRSRVIRGSSFCRCENILLEDAADLSPARYPDALASAELPLTYGSIRRRR